MYFLKRLAALGLLASLSVAPLTLAPSTLVAHASPPATLTLSDPIVAPLTPVDTAPAVSTPAPGLTCGQGTCGQPNTTLGYNGGPIVTDPKIYFVRYSTSDTAPSPATGFSPQTFSPTEPNGAGAVKAIVNSNYSNWWMREYSRPAAGQFIHAGTFAGTINITEPALATDTTISSDTIANDIQMEASTGQLPAYDSNTIFVIFLRAGQAVTIGSSTSRSNFCAYHSGWQGSGPDLNFIVMPNQASSPNCQYVGPSATPFQNQTSLLAHEIAETVTDPVNGAGWIDSSGIYEIGDICDYAWPPASAVVTSASASYYLQSLWSNSSHSCMTFKSPTVLSATTTQSAPSITVHLRTNTGSPVPGAAVQLLDASHVVATAVTSSTGLATFDTPSADPSTLSAYFAGSASTAGAQASVAVVTPAPAITAVIPSATGAHVAWTPAAPASASYVATATTPTSPTSPVATCTGATRCTLGGLTTGATYIVTVRSDAASPASDPYEFTARANPTAPAQLPAPIVTSLSGGLNVIWAREANNGGTQVLSYTATVSPGGAYCTSSSTTECVIGYLTNGANYQVSVTATNAIGTSAPSATTTGTPLLATTLALHAPASPVESGGSLTVAVSTSPAAPNQPLALRVGNQMLYAPANTGGVASFTFTVQPGKHALVASLGPQTNLTTARATPVASSYTATYAFAGYVANPPRAPFNLRSYTIADANGPLSAAVLASLSTRHVLALAVFVKGQAPHLVRCAAVNTTVECLIPTKYHPYAVQARLGIGTGYNLPLTTGPSPTKNL